MKSKQAVFRSNLMFKDNLEQLRKIKPQLLFVFGDVTRFRRFSQIEKLNPLFQDAVVLGCSTAGDISDDGVSDLSLVVNAIHFDDPTIKIVPFVEEVRLVSDSYDAGRRIGEKIDKVGIRGVCVLAPGVNVDGAEIVNGLIQTLEDKAIPVFGGLAGDGAQFKETRTTLNGEFYPNHIVGFSIYGEKLSVECNYMGGWKPFGEPMKITKCKQNVIYSINDEPALSVYSKVIGAEAKNLPASGLSYPMQILDDKTSVNGIVRTPLSINKGDASIMLAGSVTEGSWMRIMETSFADLSGAAALAANQLVSDTSNVDSDSFALIVSCVGRKLVMKERISDEIASVRSVLGQNCRLGGFYSYGEICPDWEFKTCSLHNETITITRFHEKN